MNGHSAVVKALIKAGARLEAVNGMSFTPLHIAAQDGQWEAMNALIAAGAEVNSRLPDGATPLYLASEGGHTVAVRELRRAKANALLASVSKWGDSRVPLGIAALQGHSGVIRELIGHGGIEGCGGASGGVGALRCAAEIGHVGILAMLAEAGVVDSGTALLGAAGLGQTAAVKFLFQQRRGKNKTADGGAYVNTRHPTGRTPLFCNIMLPRCSPKMVRVLVDAGADTARAFPVTQAGRVFFNDTALTLTTFQLGKKMVDGKPATEDQLDRLEAIRRLLMRVEAVHAASWLWTSGSFPGNRAAEAADGATTPSALTSMMPVMRTRARRRGVLLQALFRNSVKP